MSLDAFKKAAYGTFGFDLINIFALYILVQ